MDVWSNVFLDDNKLINIVFNYSDYTVEQIRKTMNILKAYYKDGASTVQLIGFIADNYRTKNPLAMAGTVLTPAYRIIYNLNKIRFYIKSTNEITDSDFTSLAIPIEGHGLTYGKLKNILATKGIDISYSDMEDTDYILKRLDTEKLCLLKIFFLLVTKNTTEDYIKYLMTEKHETFISIGLLKELDYNVIYKDDSLVVRFNLPVHNTDEFINFLRQQVLEMSQYS